MFKCLFGHKEGTPLKNLFRGTYETLCEKCGKKLEEIVPRPIEDLERYEYSGPNNPRGKER